MVNNSQIETDELYANRNAAFVSRGGVDVARTILQICILILAIDTVTGFVRFSLTTYKIWEQLSPNLIILPIVLICGVFILLGFFDIKRSYFKTATISVFILFFLIGLFGISVAMNRGNDFQMALNDGGGFLIFSFLSPLLFYSVSDCRKKPTEKLNFLSKWFLYISIILIVLTVAMFAFVILTAQFDNKVTMAIFEMFDSATLAIEGNWLRYYSLNIVMLPMIIFLMACFFFKGSGMVRFLYVIGALSALALVMVILLRSQMVVIVFGAIMFSSLNKKMILLMVVIFVILICAVLVVPYTQDIIIERSASIVDPANTSTSEKMKQVEPLLRTWIDYPILGNGFGMQSPYYIRNAEKPYLYEVEMLALLAKLGLVGMMLILSSAMIVFISFYRSLKAFLRLNEQYLALFAMWGIFCLMTLILTSFSNPFFSSRLCIGIFMFLAVYSDILKFVLEERQNK